VCNRRLERRIVIGLVAVVVVVVFIDGDAGAGRRRFVLRQEAAREGAPARDVGEDPAPPLGLQALAVAPKPHKRQGDRKLCLKKTHFNKDVFFISVSSITHEKTTFKKIAMLIFRTCIFTVFLFNDSILIS